MKKPKASKASVTTSDETTSLTTKADLTSVTSDVVNETEPAKKRKFNPLDNMPLASRGSGRKKIDTSSAEAVSIDKHCEKLKYKIAYSAHKLADELATALSTSRKKDHNNIKGLVWSLGVLYDKITGGATEAISVRIPAKLLDNVKLVIAAQVERKASQTVGQVIDVSPPAPKPHD